MDGSLEVKKQHNVVLLINGKAQLIFNGVKETAREVGYNKRLIYKSLRSGHKSRKGYTFKYLEDYESENNIEPKYEYV